MAAPRLDLDEVERIVAAALAEDLGRHGDVTTDALIEAECSAGARIVARQELVLAGLPVARAVFHRLDSALEFHAQAQEGQSVAAGTAVASLAGSARSILRGERAALNFLMRLCGIATAAAAAVAETAGTACRVLDTRKTAPGLRLLDKYAVRCGGAENHRQGLYDAILIKDNHLALGLPLSEAVRRALSRGHPRESVTVEVRTLLELEEAVAAGAGRALLDNMTLAELSRAVALARGRIVLEASGGWRPGSLRAVAGTGVDCVSVGWLTHSAPAADLALDLERRS